LLGVLFIFSTVGFVSDIMEMGRQPALRFVLSVLLSGGFARFYAASGFVLRGRLWKALVPAFIHAVHVDVRAGQVASGTSTGSAGGSRRNRPAQSRLTLDGIAAMCVVGLGYGCLVYVTITESRRYVHIYAEMVLASEIHRVLVPSIHSRIGNFEFYGRSLPSGEVGGDLSDLAGTEDRWAA
jgi:hypothetical protein